MSPDSTGLRSINFTEIKLQERLSEVDREVFVYALHCSRSAEIRAVIVSFFFSMQRSHSIIGNGVHVLNLIA